MVSAPDDQYFRSDRFSKYPDVKRDEVFLIGLKGFYLLTDGLGAGVPYNIPSALKSSSISGQ